jgi:ABC-type transporter Mla subunit MlaD
MQFANYEEFRAALGRLYDSTLEMKGRIEQIGEKVERLGDKVDTLADATTRLLHATENLQSVAETRERRLDRAEITLEAILEDLRRSRRTGTP